MLCRLIISFLSNLKLLHLPYIHHRRPGFRCAGIDWKSAMTVVAYLPYVVRMVSGLEEQVKRNQRQVMECVERLDSLYERLQLNIHNKFQFLAENQGTVHKLRTLTVSPVCMCTVLGNFWYTVLRIRIHEDWKPDPYQSQKPDPRYLVSRIRICKLKSWSFLEAYNRAGGAYNETVEGL
jgi:hypothetical protein